jgi:hypothetical protein
LVYDLEGGTFEVSRLTIDNGVKVVAANGDPYWGGEGFDPAREAALHEGRVEAVWQGHVQGHARVPEAPPRREE